MACVELLMVEIQLDSRQAMILRLRCEGILARALIDWPRLLVGKSCMRFYSEWGLICYLDTYSIYAATMNDYFASLDLVARVGTLPSWNCGIEEKSEPYASDGTIGLALNQHSY